jgi:hypothetical protein
LISGVPERYRERSAVAVSAKGDATKIERGSPAV